MRCLGRLGASMLLVFELCAGAGCYPKPKRPLPFAGVAEHEASLAEQNDRLLFERIDQLQCRGAEQWSGDGPPDLLEEYVDDLDGASAKTLVAFAEVAARCSSEEAAAIVYRLVPALLLKRLEPKEIERVYHFLERDRSRAVSLFRAALEGASRALDLDGVREPPELEKVHLDAVLGVTCEELAGVTPQYASQLRLALAVLERRGCATDKDGLILRSLESTSRARAAACEHVDANRRKDLADAVTTAAETDPGEAEPSRGGNAPPANGIVGAIVGAIVSPLTQAGEERDPPRLTYPGRWRCEPIAERLRRLE